MSNHDTIIEDNDDDGWDVEQGGANSKKKSQSATDDSFRLDEDGTSGAARTQSRATVESPSTSHNGYQSLSPQNDDTSPKAVQVRSSRSPTLATLLKQGKPFYITIDRRTLDEFDISNLEPTYHMPDEISSSSGKESSSSSSSSKIVNNGNLQQNMQTMPPSSTRNETAFRRKPQQDDDPSSMDAPLCPMRPSDTSETPSYRSARNRNDSGTSSHHLSSRFRILVEYSKSSQSEEEDSPPRRINISIFTGNASSPSSTSNSNDNGPTIALNEESRLASFATDVPTDEAEQRFHELWARILERCQIQKQTGEPELQDEVPPQASSTAIDDAAVELGSAEEESIGPPIFGKRHWDEEDVTSNDEKEMEIDFQAQIMSSSSSPKDELNGSSTTLDSDDSEIEKIGILLNCHVSWPEHFVGTLRRNSNNVILVPTGGKQLLVVQNCSLHSFGDQGHLISGTYLCGSSSREIRMYVKDMVRPLSSANVSSFGKTRIPTFEQLKKIRRPQDLRRIRGTGLPISEIRLWANTFVMHPLTLQRFSGKSHHEVSSYYALMVAGQAKRCWHHPSVIGYYKKLLVYLWAVENGYSTPVEFSQDCGPPSDNSLSSSPNSLKVHISSILSFCCERILSRICVCVGASFFCSCFFYYVLKY